ncbi:MAG: hypothetical protein ABI823_03890 [Bryobacteraceae bacterium]
MSVIGVDLDQDLVEEQLERILRSLEFRGADRPSRLLRHLVEQTLAGRGALLKEFSLAIDVLGRDEKFDPRSDAIVRVEVSRLRGRLRKYYQGAGRTDEVLIDIPTGVYQPAFRRVFLSAEAPIPLAPKSEPSNNSWWIPALGVAALVLAVIALSATRPEPPARHAQMVRITGEGGRSEFPSGSRNTDVMVYASDRGGKNLNIWLQSLPGGDPRQLTTDQADDYDPDLSPDGRLVAYQSDRNKPGIYLRSTGESEVEKLVAPRGNRPRFSPDGRYLAYWTGGGEYGNLIFIDQTGCQVAELATGATRKIAPGFAIALHPIWSPDGKQLLFWGRKVRGGFADWWIVDLDGGEPKKTGAIEAILAQGLGPPQWFHQVITPDRWLPNGDVLFSAGEAESTNIWRISISGSSVIPGQLSRVTSGPNLDLFPAAIDDRFIAYSVVTRTVDVWSIAADTNQGIARGAPARLTDDATWESFPAVAMDGKTLLYGRKSSAARLPQFLNASTGAVSSAAIKLPEQFVGAIPVLSASGRSSVLMVEEAAHRRSSYFVDRDSGLSRRLCVGCRPWIVDDKQVIINPGNQSSFVRIDLETGSQNTLLESKNGSLRFPGISPDGRWLAFEFTTGTGSEIALAPIGGHAPAPEADWVPVTAAGDAGNRPRFSPNGKLLYYVSQQDGHLCIWARPISDGKPTGPAFAVAHFHSAQNSLANLLSPDFNLSIARDKLVYNAAQIRSNIWLFDTSSERETDALRAGLRLHP